MQGSPTRERNGNPATASRNPAEATSPPRGAMESMEAVQNLVQMLLGHGIDSSVPAPGHTGSKIRLPLQYFDNVDMERNTPQGWVEQSTKQRAKRGIQPTAIVLLTDESGVGQWRLGRVFHWDEKTSTYHVHLANALGQIVEDSSVALPRLSVCFLAEPMHEFAQRVAAAQHVHMHRYASQCLLREACRGTAAPLRWPPRVAALAPCSRAAAWRRTPGLPGKGLPGIGPARHRACQAATSCSPPPPRALALHRLVLPQACTHTRTHTHTRTPWLSRRRRTARATRPRRSCSSAST